MNIILGITGSIAASKVPDIIRQLKKQRHTVTAILTDSASKFVTPLTVGTYTESKVYTNSDYFSSEMNHLSILKAADVMVVCPATANSIAKFANGIADDLLSASFLSFTGPKCIVPAMHTEMYENSITLENIERLKKHSIHFLGPDYGDLACGDVGLGRMVESELIIAKINSFSRPLLDFSGKRIVITAGGTREAIDNVRCITNNSTGNLGKELALYAASYGAKVDFISPNEPISNPLITHIKVNTVNEMQESLNDKILGSDALIMSAAISDFTVKRIDGKISRSQNLDLEFESTPDLTIEAINRFRPKHVVGFCLADSNLEEVAKEKLYKKDLDVIIANNSTAIGASKRDIKIIKKGSNVTTVLENENLETVSYKILETIT